MMMTIKLLFALCLFLALAAFTTFPLILHLKTHTAPVLSDPLLNAWILAWDVHALLRDPLHLFDGNIFYPVERSLAFSDHLLGVLPIFAPIYLLTGNPVAGYNTLLVLSFALSGFSAFCLSYHWTRAFWPSLVAGTLFGFAPFRFGQIGHLQLLNLFWAPLTLLFLDRFLRTRRWRHLAGFAGFYWLQVLSSVYLAYMVTLAVMLYASYYALVVDRTLLRFSVLPKILAFVGGILAVLLPFHLPYLDVRRSWGAFRNLDEIVRYSPDLLSYLAAPPLMNDLYRSVFKPVDPWSAYEKWLFPGLVLPVLVLLGSCCTIGALSSLEARRLRQVFWLIMGAAVVISLGPYLIVFGRETRIPLPYLFFYHLVPGWTGLRVPGRFALLAIMAAAPLATLGAIKCCEAVGRCPGFRAWPRFASPLISAWIVGLFLLELGWKPLPLVTVPTPQEVPEVYRWLAAKRPGPIVELPFGRWEDYRYLYFNTVHWLPLVNGQSGFFPPTYAEIKEALAELPAKRAVEYAGALGVRAIVVHTDKLPPDKVSRWNARQPADSGLRRLAAFGPDVVYSVPPAPVASSVRAETSVPDWVPARKRVKLGLLLHADNNEPWVHPRPHGRSTAVIQWTDALTGVSLATTARLQLPLVVCCGETVTIPLDLSPPNTPGTYTFRVSIPSRGLAIEPRAVEVREAALPTSRDAPHLLSATYVFRHGAESVTVSTPDPVTLEVTATNTGQAIWLAQTSRDKGAVSLGWRWLKEGQALAGLSGRAPIRYDIFPGQFYRFQMPIAPPGKPGVYLLELDLVSEHVTWFSEVGTPPLRLTVDVQTDSRVAFTNLLDRLRSPVPDAPHLVLSADRVGDAVRLTLAGSVGERSWMVDAYLLLQGPEGTLWFYDDDRRLVPRRKGTWIPLAKGVELRKGTRGSTPLVSLSLAGMRPGTYTWYLLLTGADSYRTIAEARTSVEVRP